MDIQDYRVKELNLSKKARILSVYRLVIGEYPLCVGLLGPSGPSSLMDIQIGNPLV
jgi:hypothetical protein